MPDLGQTLVKDRRNATAFPTHEKAYKALCDIGAQPSAYAIRAFRQLGSTFKKDWYALCTHTNEWLKMPEIEKGDIKAEMRDVALLPIVRTLLDYTGPADLLLTLAEAMRQRGQYEPEHDREFWRIARKAAQIAAEEIDKAAGSIGAQVAGEN